MDALEREQETYALEYEDSVEATEDLEARSSPGSVRGALRAI